MSESKFGEIDTSIEIEKLNFTEEPYICRTGIKDLLVLSRPYYPDERGSFQELFRVPDLEKEVGRKIIFVQESLSGMIPDTIKGIHCERQDKLLKPISGEFLFVEVDLRPNSPTFKKWIKFHINASLEGKRYSVFVPEGCGNSMAILGSEPALLSYSTSAVYDKKEAERVVRYDDPLLSIPWPIKSPILSERDEKGYSLSDFQKIYYPNA